MIVRPCVTIMPYVVHPIFGVGVNLNYTTVSCCAAKTDREI
jgi:hypothetical protein